MSSRGGNHDQRQYRDQQQYQNPQLGNARNARDYSGQTGGHYQDSDRRYDEHARQGGRDDSRTDQRGARFDNRSHGAPRQYYDRDRARDYDRHDRGYRDNEHRRGSYRSRSRSRSRSNSPRRYRSRSRSRTPPSRRHNEQGAQVAPRVMTALEIADALAAQSQKSATATTSKSGPPAGDTPLKEKPDTNKDKTDAAKPKKRKAEAQKDGTGNTRLQAQFGLWQSASDQVHGVKEQGATTSTTTTTDLANQKTTKPKSIPSFANTRTNCCLLCRRQFPSEDSLRKHEKKSKIHRANLLDRAKRHAAHASLIKHGVIAPNRTHQQSTNYIDRAKERRQLHNQPSRPRHHGQRASSPHKEEADEVGAKSRGLEMLSKMGWSQGQGLGADGGGRDAPIETSLYAQGVGLGASGGKLGDAVEEADRSTRGDYNSKGRDKARERLEALSR